MKFKVTFTVIGAIALLMIGLCIPTANFAQKKPKENSITKNIMLPHHIDGGTTIMLDLSRHIGLTDDETKRLTNALSVKQTDKTAATKGVTIELLKPLDSIVNSKALVIRQIKVNPAVNIVDAAKHADVKVGFTFKIQTPVDDVTLQEELIKQPPIDDVALQEELIKQLDGNNVIFTEAVQGNRDTVLIRLYNTTKSRINLKNWQIRLTYGAMPDATETTVRVVDRMSNVNEKVEVLPKLRNTRTGIDLPRNIIMFRKIDFKLLDDPTKTQDEQLAAISDGTRQSGWHMKKPSNQPEWVEINDAENKLKNQKEPLILVVPGKGNPKVETRVIIKPRKQIENASSPPTDDR
ncbi:MAG: hypothetical protein OXI43_19475 [Candidatus Poribacteria bacterium]|nr:hypothetical protein [Candidatus Poribacteria bacterium]